MSTTPNPESRSAPLSTDADGLSSLNQRLASGGFRARALYLFEKGVKRITVCAYRTKNPFKKAWHDGGSATTVDEIQAFHKENPNYNSFAVAGDDNCIIDLDFEDAAAAIEDIAGRALPRTLRVRGSKPFPCGHLYFRSTEYARSHPRIEVQSGTDTYVNAKGETKRRRLVDGKLRGADGVVGPGSLHPDGCHYTVVDDAPLVEIPDWLIDALDEYKKREEEVYRRAPRPSNSATEPILTARQGKGKASPASVAVRLMGRSTPYTEESERALSQGMGFSHRHEANAAFALHLVQTLRDSAEQLAVYEKFRLQQDHRDPAALDKALALVKDSLAGARKLITVRGSEVQPANVQWVWKGVLGHFLTLFSGNSSEGKSPVALDLGARITKGAAWPDGATNNDGPRSVIIFNYEDDFQTKILPRFLAAGGDPSRLYHVKGSVPVNAEESRLEDIATLEHDLSALIKTVKEVGDVSLVIVDPVTNHLGSAKYTDHQQVRTVLTPLALACAEHEFSAVLIGHLNRGTPGTIAQFRTLGAGFYHVSRLCFFFMPDPENDPTITEHKYRHVMTEDRDKEFAMRYHTEKIDVEHEGETLSEVIRMRWDGATDARTDEAIDPESSQVRGLQHAVARALSKLLGSAPGRKKFATECVNELVNQFPELKDRKEVNWGRIRRLAKVSTGKSGKVNVWSLSEGQQDEMQFL